MHRKDILKKLTDYQRTYFNEKKTVQEFRLFIEKAPQCFERTHESGHITGSAFVLSADQSCVLFTLHTKLQKWFQLGGHADGYPLIHEVALKETIEESGISKFFPHPYSTIPIDLDIHEIPSNKKEKAHLHYDVRFVFHSQENNFICSNESLSLKWIPLDEIPLYNNDPSIMRVIKKIGVLCQVLNTQNSIKH